MKLGYLQRCIGVVGCEARSRNTGHQIKTCEEEYGTGPQLSVFSHKKQATDVNGWQHKLINS